MSDRYAFDVIKQRVEQNGGECAISYRELSEILGCHPNTAWLICKRLKAVGKIEVLGRTGREGYIYRVTDD